MRWLAGPSSRPSHASRVILAPWREDARLRARVAALRAAGEVVLWDLPGTELDQHRETHRLVETGDGWEVQ